MKKPLIVIGCLLLLSGCNQKEKLEANLQPVRVTLQPIQYAQKEVILQAQVTQNGEIISDADEVQFEVWQQGNSIATSQKLVAQWTNEKFYEARATLKTGEYYVYVHTIANGQHVMPKVAFAVEKK